MPPPHFPAKLVYCPEGSEAVCFNVAKLGWTLAAAGVLTLAAHAAWWKFAPLSLRRFFRVPLTKGYQLVVELQFKNRDDLEAFKPIWAELAQYVAKYEPQTLAYELVESEVSENKLLIFERYTTKEALTEIHRTSTPFKKFWEKVGQHDITVEKSSETYFETALGYV